MPLVQIDGAKLTLIRPTNFSLEKETQRLVEQNLLHAFNCSRQLHRPALSTVSFVVASTAGMTG
jgi:hypothetical protein